MRKWEDGDGTGIHDNVDNEIDSELSRNQKQGSKVSSPIGLDGGWGHAAAFAYSISTVAETRDRALSFF